MFFSLKIRLKWLIVFIILVISTIILAKFLTSAASADECGVSVPIIMYHSVLQDESLWGDYVISPMTLEEDIIYLKENGYEGVFVSDLIAYVHNGTPLPEKPVILTFDDGCYNFYTYCMPIMEKYNFKCTVSVVGSYTEAADNDDTRVPTYSYLGTDDIAQLRKTGLVEIANHSYNMHLLSPRRGVSINDGESYEDYRSVFLSDIFKTQQLLETRCGFRPDVYTYPFGITCDPARRLVKNAGFEASLGVEEKPNTITINDTDCLYNLSRYNRPSFISTEDFMKKALKK